MDSLIWCLADDSFFCHWSLYSFIGLSLSLALSLARTLHNCFHVSTEFIPWFDTINTHIWTSLVKFWTIVVIRLFPDRTGQLPNEIFVIVCKLWFGTLVVSFICVYKIYLINHDKLKMIAMSEQKPKASKIQFQIEKLLFFIFSSQFGSLLRNHRRPCLTDWSWLFEWLIDWFIEQPFGHLHKHHTDTQIQYARLNKSVLITNSLHVIKHSGTIDSCVDSRMRWIFENIYINVFHLLEVNCNCIDYRSARFRNSVE